MRQYTLEFIDPRRGEPGSAVAGENCISFLAPDDAAALQYIATNLLRQLELCARGQLSSMNMVTDPNARNGTRLVDDSHENPEFQETTVRYNPTTKTVEVDFESTRTAVMNDLAVLRSSASER